MDEQEVQEIAGMGVAALERLGASDTQWWAPWEASVPYAALLVVVLALLVWGQTRIRKHRCDTPRTQVERADFGRKLGMRVGANSEWWQRTQWALEATVAKDVKMSEYGVRLLIVLATSEVASSREKLLLDAVWMNSVTELQDEHIFLLVQDARESKDLPEAQRKLFNKSEAGATHSPVETAMTATYHRKYDPADKKQVVTVLRHEILVARLKVTLDKELGRETSPVVEQLALMSTQRITRS